MRNWLSTLPMVTQLVSAELGFNPFIVIAPELRFLFAVSLLSFIIIKTLDLELHQFSVEIKVRGQRRSLFYIFKVLGRRQLSKLGSIGAKHFLVVEKLRVYHSCLCLKLELTLSQGTDQKHNQWVCFSRSQTSHFGCLCSRKATPFLFSFWRNCLEGCKMVLLGG